MRQKQRVVLEVEFGDDDRTIAAPAYWDWSELTGEDVRIVGTGEVERIKQTMNPKDQYHLVVAWSQEEGWFITETEPASDGWIWSEDDEEWRDACSEEDNKIYSRLSSEFIERLC